jgi:nickel transport protein
MTHKNLRNLLLAMASIGFAAQFSEAAAHDIWLTLDGDTGSRRAVINYGHPHDRPPAFAEKVVDLFEIKSGEKTSLLSGLTPAVIDGTFVVETKPFADDGHVLLATQYDNGYWVKTKDGVYLNATKRLVPDAAEGLWSSKFAKAVTGPGSPWQTVLGHDLELVPLSDPAEVEPGQSLKLRVLFHGKPLAGGEIERGDGITAVPEKDIPRFATNADGVATVPIVQAGAHLLVIDYKVTPSAVPEQANEDLYTATLWFKVTSKHADARQ